MIGRVRNEIWALIRARNLACKYPTPHVGDSNGIGVGDFVIAAGNLLSLDHTVEFNIISQTSRNLLKMETP